MPQIEFQRLSPGFGRCISQPDLESDPGCQKLRVSPSRNLGGMMKITSPNPVRSNQDSGIFRFILFCGLQEYRQGLLIICFLKGKNGQVGMTRLDFAGEDGLSLKEIVAHEQDPYNVKKGRLVMAWIDMLAVMASRGYPSSYSYTPGSWIDEEGYEELLAERQRME